jgi:hypothetical protein
MSSIVDFLEKIGSEARWHDASLEEIAQALADAGIEAPMCTAILTRNAADVQALLGVPKLIGDQVPSPQEIPVPPKPKPGEEEEEEEEGDETREESKASNSASSPSLSSSFPL